MIHRASSSEKLVLHMLLSPSFNFDRNQLSQQSAQPVNCNVSSCLARYQSTDSALVLVSFGDVNTLKGDPHTTSYTHCIRAKKRTVGVRGSPLSLIHVQKSTWVWTYKYALIWNHKDTFYIMQLRKESYCPPFYELNIFRTPNRQRHPKYLLQSYSSSTPPIHLLQPG